MKLIFVNSILGLMVLSFFSCKKDTSQGRGTAITYAVQDTVRDFSFTTHTDQYNIQVITNPNQSSMIEIVNYANITQTNNKQVSITGQLSGTTLTIPKQIIVGPSNATVDYIEVFETTGYFGNDSIYLKLSYMNRFDPYVGYMWGTKK